MIRRRDGHDSGQGRATGAPRGRWRPIATAWLVSLLLVATPLLAAEPTIVRVGTGGTGGTYFPIGSLIAQAISESLPGAGSGKTGGGVPGLLAVSQISNGSIANVEGLRNRTLDAGLVQADVAYWAHQGLGLFARQGPMASLRAIAHLYPESLHLVARRDSGIETVPDLRGRRVSLDVEGSGTLHDAELILEHYGLGPGELERRYLKPHFAAQAIADGTLDAFFVFAGYPAGAIINLAGTAGAVLVPLKGRAIDRLVEAHPYFGRGSIPAGTYGRGVIPAGTYAGVGDTPTVTVGAQLLVRSDLEADLVYRITRALWSEATLESLRRGHPKGAEIDPALALAGIGLPLHEGAARYYREAGLLSATGAPSQ